MRRSPKPGAFDGRDLQVTVQLVDDEARESLALDILGHDDERPGLDGRYLTLYNSRRPHSSLDRKTPDQAYFDRLPQIAAA